ncbi:MAG: enoyl-CoA hydratase-related protein, partial [Acidobacteriota bacterium]
MTAPESHFEPKPPEAFDFEDILYAKSDGVARVTINRPEVYNAYRTPTLRELSSAFEDAAYDDAVAVVVFTGAGEKAFCTGGDVKEYASTYTRRPRDYWKWMGLFIDTVDRLRHMGKPT